MKTSNYLSPSEDLSNGYEHISFPAKQYPATVSEMLAEDSIGVNYCVSLEQHQNISESEARQTLYEHLSWSSDDLKFGRITELDTAINSILSELNCIDLQF